MADQLDVRRGRYCAMACFSRRGISRRTRVRDHPVRQQRRDVTSARHLVRRISNAMGLTRGPLRRYRFIANQALQACPVPASAGDDIPNIRPLASHARQKHFEWDVTGLSTTMMFDQRANRFEMDAEPSERAQQSWLHHRTPMRDAMVNAHADQGLDQS